MATVSIKEHITDGMSYVDSLRDVTNDNWSLLSQPIVTLYEYPKDKCSVCGETLNLERRCVHVYAARKVALLPGPMGMTHNVEYKRGKKGNGLAAIIEFSIVLAITVSAICWGIYVGMGLLAFTLILPIGGLIGFLLSFLNKKTGIATPIEDLDIPGVKNILKESGWELGKEPSRSAVLCMSENWPWEQKIINAERKAERKQLIEKLRPTTFLDKICLLVLILVAIFAIGGLIWITTSS